MEASLPTIGPIDDAPPKTGPVTDPRRPMRAAIDRQIAAWPHLEHEEYAAHRAILQSCADSLDAMSRAVRDGRAQPLQAINAAKTLFTLLQKVSPDNASGQSSANDWDVELPLFEE